MRRPPLSDLFEGFERRLNSATKLLIEHSRLSAAFRRTVVLHHCFAKDEDHLVRAESQKLDKMQQCVDSITPKAKVIGSVCQRVRGVLLTTLPDADCMAVAIASTAPRDRDVVLGMVLNAFHFKLMASKVDEMALSDEEWSVIFGNGLQHSSDGGVGEVCRDKVFEDMSAQIQEALRCSLEEIHSRAQWEKPITRLACYIALHSDAAEDRVGACLGGLVKADSRRLDDVRSQIEDEGADDLLLSRAVISIARAVA